MASDLGSLLASGLLPFTEAVTIRQKSDRVYDPTTNDVVGDIPTDTAARGAFTQADDGAFVCELLADGLAIVPKANDQLIRANGRVIAIGSVKKHSVGGGVVGYSLRLKGDPHGD
jgi:hypothetical protein